MIMGLEQGRRGKTKKPQATGLRLWLSVKDQSGQARRQRAKAK
jgi:hypothetical protein